MRWLFIKKQMCYIIKTVPAKARTVKAFSVLSDETGTLNTLNKILLTEEIHNNER